MSIKNSKIVNMSSNKIKIVSIMNAKGKMMHILISVFIFFFFTDFIPKVLGSIFKTSILDILKEYEQISGIPKNAPNITFVHVVYLLLLSGAFSLGIRIFFLDFLRNRTAATMNIFEGFSYYLKATTLFIIKSMIIYLGFCCFFIPGIIMSYSYRQSFYILAENPGISVIEALKTSRIIMNGNKLKALELDFSYFFLFLAGALPSMIMSYAFKMNINTLEGSILYFISSLTLYLVFSYYYLGQTVFYELILEGDFKNFKYKGESFFREC